MSIYKLKQSRHSSHSQVLRILGQGYRRRLLDVGCADGDFSSQLVAQGWDVTGIEPSEGDAALAAERGVRVVKGTIEEALPKLSETFDAVLLADVLEHCVEPWEQLSRVKDNCTPSTVVVISIPNVAHLSVRSQLALGRFAYTDKGILDRTHMRFFTRKSLIELITQAGFQIQNMWFTPAPVELVFPRLNLSKEGRALLDVNAMLARSWPSLFAYQFIALCSLSKSMEHP